MDLWHNATKSVLTVFDNNDPSPFTIPSSFSSLVSHKAFPHLPHRAIYTCTPIPTVNFPNRQQPHDQKNPTAHDHLLELSPLLPIISTFPPPIAGLCSARASRVIISPFPFSLSLFKARFVSLYSPIHFTICILTHSMLTVFFFFCLES